MTSNGTNYFQILPFDVIADIRGYLNKTERKEARLVSRNFNYYFKFPLKTLLLKRETELEFRFRDESVGGIKRARHFHIDSDFLGNILVEDVQKKIDWVTEEFSWFIDTRLETVLARSCKKIYNDFLPENVTAELTFDDFELLFEDVLKGVDNYSQPYDPERPPGFVLNDFLRGLWTAKELTEDIKAQKGDGDFSFNLKKQKEIMIPEENFDPPDEIFGVFEREIELLVGPGDNEEQKRKLKEMFKFTITDEYTVQVVKTKKVAEGGAGLAEGGEGAR